MNLFQIFSARSYSMISSFSSYKVPTILKKSPPLRLLRRSLSTILKRLFEIRKEKKFNISEFIFNILFKIVFNDLLITRSRRSERSHHHYGEIVEDIIDHDLKENITSKLANIFKYLDLQRWVIY